jgi:thiamine-phosphate pyrophosphorylase
MAREWHEPHRRLSVNGLYAITPDSGDGRWLSERVGQALDGGARLVQYRSKIVDRALKLHHARALAALCRTRGALFIVNDDVEIARECGADGVHLGCEDMPIAAARGRLGPGILIGASCYDQLTRAQECVDAGADYLAFGSFFASVVKPEAPRASTALLQEARKRWRLPLVAIGGITPGNAAPLLEAGADALAVIGALFMGADTFAAAQAFQHLFEALLRPAALDPTA